MPRNPIDYSKTIMYKIVCKDLLITDIYVGHTTDFKARKHNHKLNCCNNNGKKYNLNVYQFIRENNGWDNWDMVKIEDYPCLTILDAKKRERELIESLNATLNRCIPTRTVQEYYLDNQDKIKQQRKEFRINNQDKINEYQKEYRLENQDEIKKRKNEWYQNNKNKLKENFNCPCGGCYTLENKTKHFKTKKHQLYLDQQ